MVTGFTPEHGPVTPSANHSTSWGLSANQSRDGIVQHCLAGLGNVKFLLGYIPAKVSQWTVSDEDMMFHLCLERFKRNPTML